MQSFECDATCIPIPIAPFSTLFHIQFWKKGLDGVRREERRGCEEREGWMDGGKRERTKQEGWKEERMR